VFRFCSKVYHYFNASFRSASIEAPDAVKRAIELSKETRGEDPGDYYEFGLFRGFTLLTAYRRAERLRLKGMHFHGFDSFEGLPDLDTTDLDDGRFFEGQFACSEEKVKKNLEINGMDLTRTNLIKGYYSESLTEDLRERGPLSFRPAAVVMLDCDLYSSTRDALDWVEPYLGDGTVLVFDDWHSYGDDEQQGQPQAFREYLKTHPAVRADKVFDYKHHGRVFILRET
jgi:hypothetical protein